MRQITSAEFLSLIWPKKLLTNEMLELRLRRKSDGEMRSEFFSSIQPFILRSEQCAKDFDVYYGIATRFGRGGKKIDCYRVGTVWSDLDGVKINDCRFSPKPDILVNSGGGVHAYWLLNNPYLVRGERWEPIESINRGLVRKFKGDINTIDVSRILRVPGTMNHKFSPVREVRAYAL